MVGKSLGTGDTQTLPYSKEFELTALKSDGRVPTLTGKPGKVGFSSQVKVREF